MTCSCASSGSRAGRKFKDTASADLVIRYSSDQTIFVVKPDSRNGLFYRIFNRDEICALDATRTGPRDLAVVVIGLDRLPDAERELRERNANSGKAGHSRSPN